MISEGLIDIETLSLSCRSQHSKEYVSEAVKCYKAGAYRACIVSTWIAVVFDLVDKIRELSLSGEKAAVELFGTFQKYNDQINEGNEQGTKSALEFERNILTQCRSRLQFFDEQQLVDLKRLQEDRHRCAHPSFHIAGAPYMPYAEQARSHLRNAVDHVLSVPPVQGRSAIEVFMKSVSSEYFPLDEMKARDQLLNSPVANASKPLVNSVVDALVFGFLTAESMVYRKYQVIHALNALHSIYADVVESRLAVQLPKAVRDTEDGLFAWAVFLVCTVKCAWPVLDAPSKEKVKRFVEVTPADSLAPAVYHLYRLVELRDALESRISSFGIDSLARVGGTDILKNPIKQRALALLSESRSWDVTNSVFTKIIFPIFDSIDATDVERIVALSTKYHADIPGSHGFSEFIEKVRAAELIDPDKLNKILIENNAANLVDGQRRNK